MAEFAACLHDDDRAVVKARVEACLKGNGFYRSEHRMRRSDGQIIWVQDRGDVVERDARGWALRLVGSFADITAQRQAAQVLTESEARFRSIIEVSPVPFALNDDDQNITYLNPAFIATFGYTRDDIPTLADWWPRAYPDAAYRQWVATEWATR
jgi:PAS domain-containing protein